MILELAADTPWRPGAPSPLIVGIGGSTSPGSSSELLLKAALAASAKLGARTKLIAGPEAMLPLYTPSQTRRDSRAGDMIESLRCADGVIIASPGYHGSISGMVKNALDYIEDLRTDARPYLHGRGIGCIACAGGAQATGPVLAALRAIAHALRGWPTPLGIGVTAQPGLFNSDGAIADAMVRTQISIMAEQLVSFAAR